MKGAVHERVIDRVDFIKIKNFCSPKTLSREWEDKSYVGENICKRHIKQRIDIQNVQRDLKTQQ